VSFCARAFSLLFILVFFSSAAYGGILKAANDPTDMGAGARPLALGRAYTALADDANSIFLNPAGLALTKSMQMTSMYASLLNEINYTMIGISFPLSREALGVGYIGSNVGDSVIISYRDPDTGRIVDAGEGVIGYTASAFLLTYSATLRRFADYGFLDDISVGLSAKIFNQELKGGSFEALASGSDLDLGINWRANPWLKVGVVGLNILPYESGGVLRWTSGIEEEIPSTYKAGVGAKLLGPSAPWQINAHELYLGWDVETSLKRPGLNHIGAEWWPIKYLAVRLGLDQDAAAADGGVKIDNNLTAGIGLFFNGFEFDYAFHQFGGLDDNNTHYFSLSLGIDKEEAAVVAAPPPPSTPEVQPVAKTKYINALSPSLEVVLYDEALEVAGEVEPEVTNVRMGDESVTPVDGKFSLSVPARDMGKSSFKLEAFNAAGRRLGEATFKVLRLPKFADVNEGYWARRPISLIALAGLVQGYPDSTFRPEKGVTRAELLAMLMRASGERLPLVTEKELFKDVSGSNWAAQYIKAAVSKGVAKGYPDKTFKPNNNVSRAEGVAMIARFDGIEESSDVYEKPFSDIPANHWAIKIISAAKGKGLLNYLGEGDFSLKRNLTRAEAAEIISKTSFAKVRLDELLNFTEGF
jgi:hypothetical protein